MVDGYPESVYRLPTLMGRCGYVVVSLGSHNAAAVASAIYAVFSRELARGLVRIERFYDAGGNQMSIENMDDRSIPDHVFTHYGDRVGRLDREYYVCELNYYNGRHIRPIRRIVKVRDWYQEAP